MSGAVRSEAFNHARINLDVRTLIVSGDPLRRVGRVQVNQSFMIQTWTCTDRVEERIEAKVARYRLDFSADIAATLGCTHEREQQWR